MLVLVIWRDPISSLPIVRSCSSRDMSRAYRDRRIAEGKTHQEVVRCLKHYIAHRLWRLLLHSTRTRPLTNIEASARQMSFNLAPTGWDRAFSD